MISISLNPSEHSSPPSLNVSRCVREFRDCLVEAELSDLNFRGNEYTWWNKNALRPVANKLDRVLANDRWQCAFPNAVAIFCSPDFSDHASLSLVFEPHIEKLKKPFRFYNLLLANEAFLPLVERLWYSANVVGSLMFRVSKKLRLMKKPIRDFSKDNYSGLEKRVAEAHIQLLSCQKKMLSQPTNIHALAETEATKKWRLLEVAEEAFFCQRTSINWL